MRAFAAIAPVLLLALLSPACGSSAKAKAMPAAAPALRSTLLQFVPAQEDVYPRQEATYKGGATHYRLDRGVTVTGTLQDPVANLVPGHLFFTGALPDNTVDPASVRTGETDTDGNFSLPLAPGLYAVDLIPKGAAWPAQRQFVSVTAHPDNLNFILRGGALYSGRVSDSAGAPMAGVAVRVLAGDSTPASNTVITGLDGLYSIAMGPDTRESFRLEFAAPAGTNLPRIIFGGLSALTSTVFNMAFLPVTFSLVEGSVVDAAGAAAPDVVVTVSANTGETPTVAKRLDSGQTNSGGQAIFQVRSDASGNFSLTVPVGTWTYSLSLQPPLDRAYGGLSVNPFSPGGAKAVYTLSAKKEITGHVLDPQGKPPGVSEVVISRTLALKTDQQVVRVYTDDAGVFTAQLDASLGSYDVTVIPLTGGYARCTRPGVTVPSFIDTFFVPAGKPTDGYVEDENGQPIPRVSVSLVDGSGGTAPRILAESVTPTDRDGYFKLVAPVETAQSGCRGDK